MYARRSVSDADIRRYEMFSQVSVEEFAHVNSRADESCAEPATITLVRLELQVPGELWRACGHERAGGQHRLWRRRGGRRPLRVRTCLCCVLYLSSNVFLRRKCLDVFSYPSLYNEMSISISPWTSVLHALHVSCAQVFCTMKLTRDWIRCCGVRVGGEEREIG